MIEEIDIWRTANLLIQHHGEKAALEAAQRADRMIEKGDLTGESVWRRVYNVVLELQGSKRPQKSY